MEIVFKPWGHEKWLDVNDKYVLKEIFMVKGHRSSLQYHKVKKETNYILQGKGRLSLDGKWRVLFSGDVFHIPPNVVHRVEAIDNLTMIEASTPEVDDIIRLKDDFNRGNGRIEDEHKSPDPNQEDMR